MVALRTIAVPSSRAQLLTIIQTGRVCLEALEQFAARAEFVDEYDDAAASTQANSAAACGNTVPRNASNEAASATTHVPGATTLVPGAAARNPKSRTRQRATATIEEAADGNQSKKRKLGSTTTTTEDQGASVSAAAAHVREPRDYPVFQLDAITGDVLTLFACTKDAARALIGPDADKKRIKSLANAVHYCVNNRSTATKPIFGKYFYRRPDAEERAKFQAYECPILQVCAQTGEELARYQRIGLAAWALSEHPNPDQKELKKLTNQVYHSITSGPDAKPVKGRYYYIRRFDDKAKEKEAKKTWQQRSERRRARRKSTQRQLADAPSKQDDNGHFDHDDDKQDGDKPGQSTRYNDKQLSSTSVLPNQQADNRNESTPGDKDGREASPPITTDTELEQDQDDGSVDNDDKPEPRSHDSRPDNSKSAPSNTPDGIHNENSDSKPKGGASEVHKGQEENHRTEPDDDHKKDGAADDDGDPGKEGNNFGAVACI